jgi:TolB-like protein
MKAARGMRLLAQCAQWAKIDGMASSDTSTHLEIGHVLFLDSVGYSKLLLDEQRALQSQLNEIVRSSEEFRVANAAGKLVRLPAGDGMALVFLTGPEAPLKCAIEISQALKRFPDLRMRIGIHSGPVNVVKDIDGRANIAGAGINIAQRVMDCADAGHILVSKRVAEDLVQSAQWRPFLHDFGECEVKHAVKIGIFNFYDGEVGNPQKPQKIRDRPASKQRRRNLLVAGAVLFCAVAVLFIYETRFGVSDKSIAVLPFVNMSADPENAFFADGIQDDILTSLSKIKDLRVISRTSVMAYRGGKETQNLREIGRTLGVTNVLEGSVRRDGNRIAVTVQLIDAVKDRHLWANRYDRTLADSLGLQGELATEIAEALRVTLTADEKARVAKKPTDNEAAYVLYLRANQIARNPDTLLEDYKRADELYSEAIGLDPNFALAHAQLASTRAQVFHYYEPTEEWKSKARREADTAVQLQPNLAEAHLALGQCIYWIDSDFPHALQEFQIVLKFSPNNAEVRSLMAAITRRQGKWEEGLNAYEEAQKLDPQNANIVRNLLFTAMGMRRWEEASRWAEKFRTMAPASLVAKFQTGYADFWWKGDTRLLKSLVADVPAGTDPDGTVTSARWDVSMIGRDFAGARKVLEASPLKEIAYANEGTTPKDFLVGLTLLAQGDKDGAQKFLERSRPSFEAQAQEAPESPERHANLGWCYAFMGRKADAIREGERATALKPESKDALDGSLMSAYLALIYARVGETDRALSLIERLLKTPGPVDSVDYSITINDLKYRWEWDPIRKDPRFQKLVEQESP